MQDLHEMAHVGAGLAERVADATTARKGVTSEVCVRWRPGKNQRQKKKRQVKSTASAFSLALVSLKVGTNRQNRSSEGAMAGRTTAKNRTIWYNGDIKKNP